MLLAVHGLAETCKMEHPDIWYLAAYGKHFKAEFIKKTGLNRYERYSFLTTVRHNTVGITI